ncbi:Trank1 [Symbiodinium sp. CCMP2592]|nr:Trank1 [Symbiodinium sp. CCMP2592]
MCGVFHANGTALQRPGLQMQPGALAPRRDEKIGLQHIGYLVFFGHMRRSFEPCSAARGKQRPGLATLAFATFVRLQSKGKCTYVRHDLDSQSQDHPYVVRSVSSFLGKSFPGADQSIYEELAAAEASVLRARAALWQQTLPKEALQACELDVQNAALKVHEICETSLQSSALAWIHGRVKVSAKELMEDIVARLSQYGGRSETAPCAVQPSRAQRRIIECPHSLFLQGRSRTGKTICIIHRILRARRQFPAAKRLFVTRSSLLCAQVLEQLTVFGSASRDAALLRGSIGGTPVCVTWDELVKALVPKAQPAIQYSGFSSRFWPSLKAPPDLDPLLVWAEFHNRLRSFDATVLHGEGLGAVSFAEYQEKKTLDSTGGYSLTQEQYCEAVAGEGLSALGVPLQPQQRREIYRMFLEYLRLKRAYPDGTDVAVALRNAGEGALVHEIYVDEAQDFSPAELTALMSLCGHADGITIAGDTCQTINPGSAFSFQDIMDTFLRLEPKCFAGLTDGDPDKEAAKCSWDHVGDCRQMSLAFNYRSAPSIVRLANTVSELLVQMFPNTVDAVEETATAAQGGEVPLFVHSHSGSEVVDIVMGTGGRLLRSMDSTRCVVLVGADSARQSLRHQGLRSTILTVAEAKGLEFDFVVICDFFKVCGDGASWYAVEEFLKAKTAEKRRKRPTQAQRGMSHNASQRIPSLVRDLKALYVAITRSRCGCAFVESGPKSLWGPLLEHWQSRDLVKFVDGVSAYAKMSGPGSDAPTARSGQGEEAPPRAAVRLESVQQALAWLWSELQLRSGPDQKKVRKVLGQERLRLQAGHALDPLFMQHFAAAHGGVLSQASKGHSMSADGTGHPAAATSAREQADEGPWPDLSSLVDLLQLRCRMERTPQGMAAASKQLWRRGLELLAHASDDSDQRWQVYGEAEAVFGESLVCADKLLDVQLSQRARLTEPQVDSHPDRKRTQTDNADIQTPANVIRKAVQIAVSYVSSASLQDHMFADILDAKSSVEQERFRVRGWLLSGREVADFEIAASASLGDLYSRFEEFLGQRCHLILSEAGCTQKQDLSSLDSTSSLREILAETVEAWSSDLAWHRGICEILAAQLVRPSPSHAAAAAGATQLRALCVPRIWETVFAMLSRPRDSEFEARCAFRLTVERCLEYMTFRGAARKKVHLARANRLRYTALYSDEVSRDADMAARELEKLLKEEASLSPMQPIVETAAAVQALLLKASPLQLEEARVFFGEVLVPKLRRRARLHWSAARLFESLGDAREAANDFQSSSEAAFQVVAAWRDISQMLGDTAVGVLSMVEQQARASARRAALCWVHFASEMAASRADTMPDRTSMKAAEQQFLNAGCVVDVVLCAAAGSSPKQLFQMAAACPQESLRRGLLVYGALLWHEG